jgi:hypothetical protein
MTRDECLYLRSLIEKAAQSLDDKTALTAPTLFPRWKPDEQYKSGTRLIYGTNAVGDPQLYSVAQDHRSQADWTPDNTAALYVPIGLNASGYPLWSQPTGVHDAYNKGDVTDHGGVLYESLIDGNTTVPGSDERYWKVYTA